MGNNCNQNEISSVCGRQYLQNSLKNMSYRFTNKKYQQENTKNVIITIPTTSQSSQSPSINPQTKIKSLQNNQKFFKKQNNTTVLNDQTIPTTIQIIKFKNGIIQEKQVRGNIRDGYSKYTLPDTSEITLNYQNNKKRGKASLTIKNQGKFQGQIADFQTMQAKGKMTLIDGSIYQGDWKYNHPHGNGFHKLPDGSIYEGQFSQGVKSGKGKYTFSNGSVYIGNFFNNTFNGQGILTHIDGRKYTGQWKNGIINGNGIMIYNKLCKYQGQFINGQRSGKGIYYYGDGRIWDGYWESNVQNGSGKFTEYDGSIKNVTWIKGKRIDSVDYKPRKKYQTDR